MQGSRGVTSFIVRLTVLLAALCIALAVCAAPAHAAEAEQAKGATPEGQTAVQEAAVQADQAAAEQSEVAVEPAEEAQDADEAASEADGQESGDEEAPAADGASATEADDQVDAAEADKADGVGAAVEAETDGADEAAADEVVVEEAADRDTRRCAIPTACDKDDDGELAEAGTAATAAATAAPKAADDAKKTVQVASGAWDALALEMKASGNTLGSLIELAPKLTGNTSGLAFRYVIETANGKDVTVMRRYKRGVPEFSFKLNRSGNVTIKLIVSDYKGKTKELKRTLTVPTPAWDMNGMTADYQSGGSTVFVPGLTGDTSYLRYTYTWKAADGTSRSGKLKANGDVSQAWKPADGTYDVSVHVVGTDGKVRDAALAYVQGAKRASYTYSVSSDSAKVGTKVYFQAKGTDEDGKQLKFRYSLVDVNGKATVFRAASTAQSATLTAPKPGGYYTVHVDATLGNGTTATRIDPMTIWNYESLVATKSGRNVTVTANMVALPPGFTYRFTRSGSSGGVLFSQGKNNVGKFTAPADGTYEISCAVFDKDGKQVGIRTTTIKVVPRVQEIMDNMAQQFGSATNKLILVNTVDKYVAIYQGSQGNWTNIHFNRISVGKPSSPTIKGSYTVGGKGYSFSGSSYTCYYWTQISGAYLFHSVKYKLNSNVISDGRLGKEISAGCVRMDINDAKWLQQNVPGGSRIYIY